MYLKLSVLEFLVLLVAYKDMFQILDGDQN